MVEHDDGTMLGSIEFLNVILSIIYQVEVETKSESKRKKKV